MMKKCLGCGHDVYQQATLCPSCGRRDPAERHFAPSFKAGIILAFLALFVWYAYFRST